LNILLGANGEGKTKLFERISPKKTIEGFVGGFAFAIIASFIIANFYTFLSTTPVNFRGQIENFLFLTKKHQNNYGFIGKLFKMSENRIFTV
jgi:CDP-diglyceride synthetase